MVDPKNILKVLIHIDDNISRIAGLLIRSELNEASFVLGHLHAFCRAAALDIEKTINANQDEPQA